jgi:hypothetical protein
MKRLLIKTSKIFAFLLILITLILGGYISFEKYQKVQKLKQELNYATTLTWSWYDEYERIQIKTNPKTGKSTFRKVNVNDKYVIFASKKDDFSLTTSVKFIVNCKAGKKVTTSEKFKNGKNKTLLCSFAGDYLIYSVNWSGRDTDFRWEENLDGFKFSVNFKYWDFTDLDKEITTLKAQ